MAFFTIKSKTYFWAHKFFYVKPPQELETIGTSRKGESNDAQNKQAEKGIQRSKGNKKSALVNTSPNDKEHNDPSRQRAQNQLPLHLSKILPCGVVHKMQDSLIEILLSPFRIVPRDFTLESRSKIENGPTIDHVVIDSQTADHGHHGIPQPLEHRSQSAKDLDGAVIDVLTQRPKPTPWRRWESP